LRMQRGVGVERQWHQFVKWPNYKAKFHSFGGRGGGGGVRLFTEQGFPIRDRVIKCAGVMSRKIIGSR
jgi:hypothetical protein